MRLTHAAASIIHLSIQGRAGCFPANSLRLAIYSPIWATGMMLTTGRPGFKENPKR
jgi:hypothetical protein